MSKERATRRRAGVLEAAIHDATRAELAEHGYAGVTFEGVARRAHTSKPVLYRRYRSRAHLVIDAWSDYAPLVLPDRTTGSLRGDLTAILTAALDRFRRVGEDTFRGVVGQADDELLEIVTSLTRPAVATTLQSMLQAARDRGELGPAPIPERVLLLPLALLRHEILFSRGPVSPQALEEMTDTVCVPLFVAASRAAETTDGRSR